MRDENWVNDSDARNSEYGGHPKNIPSLFIPDPEPTRFTLQCQRRGHVFVFVFDSPRHRANGLFITISSLVMPANSKPSFAAAFAAMFMSYALSSVPSGRGYFSRSARSFSTLPFGLINCVFSLPPHRIVANSETRKESSSAALDLCSWPASIATTNSVSARLSFFILVRYGFCCQTLKDDRSMHDAVRR